MTHAQTIEELTARVERELAGIVNSREMELYRMMSYHMGWDQGEAGTASPSRERSRGVLCLLACEGSGGGVDRALPAAAALELVHNFTQIHDDVQGGEPKRDDRDAVWWVWGPAQAINAGDGMHALARLALFQLLDRDVDAPTTFKAVQFLDDASLKTCEGRFMDLEAQERIDMGLDSYLQMASAKTGALVSCAMKLGGLLSGSDEEPIGQLGICGERLGTAMQMHDDIRELWGDGGEGGDPSTEVMNKKKLLPVVVALENASISDKRRLGDIYFKRVLEPKDIGGLRGVLEELGVKSECQRLVEQHRVEALSALEAAGLSESGRGGIEELVGTLLS